MIDYAEPLILARRALADCEREATLNHFVAALYKAQTAENAARALVEALNVMLSRENASRR